MENRLPTKEENPKGLHAKYYIQKITGKKYAGRDWFESPEYEWTFEDVPEGSEYFVLRLDAKGEENHVKACRKAVLVYAEAIKDFIPELSKDLIKRYK